MSKKVLVIAPHPDDETLGCGGTLLKHQNNGDEIHWLICTEMDKGHPYFEIREQELINVASTYHFTSVHNLKLKTTHVDEYSMSELIHSISNIIHKIQPNILYLPFHGDVHSDHRKIFEAAYSCTKSFRYPFIEKIYMMEILSETEFSPTSSPVFTPNVFVDITLYMDKKIEIMEIFESEIHPHPFPRSIENIKALATLRGATAGCHYAESFMLLKEIK